MENTIKKKIEGFPEKAGIYFFKNSKNEVIYIGKARSLRERVRTYFQPTPDLKIHNILSETADIDFILTDSEKEAVFLENNFIQKYQPKFNLRLKDDKSFPYIRLTYKERYPGIYFSRRVEPDGSKYFGPFSPSHQARRTIHLVNKYFGIRSCEEAVPGKRKRPCLEYDLKLCSAPCVGSISEKDYRESVENALLFLEGRNEELIKVLKEKMTDASSRQEFEQAAHWRDIILTIEHIKEKPRLISTTLENMDIFGFARIKENISLYIFFMRKGKVIQSEGIFLEENEKISSAEILHNFLEKFYGKDKEVPDKILLPFEPSQKEKLSKMLSNKKTGKIEVIIPLKGKNKRLVDLATRNAEILLQKKREEFSPLLEIKKILSLKNLPIRIEGFDISNTGGEESVGSLVVFENSQPKKEDYRKYKIKTVEGPNDVASLKEVIQRRYSKILEQKAVLPDLILVDGGKGQLHASRNALEELGLGNLPLVSLAKKEEIIFIPSKKEGLRLDRTSYALKLFQNIRNEAHRFAVSFHRQRREKKSFESLLDGISGLGKKRKKALLSRFKGIEEIKKAKPEELATIIGKKAGQALLKHLGG